MSDSSRESIVFLTANGNKVEVSPVQIEKVRGILWRKFEDHQDQCEYKFGGLGAFVKPSLSSASSIEISAVSASNLRARHDISNDKVNTNDVDNNDGKQNGPIEYLDDSIDDDFYVDVLASIVDGNIPNSTQNKRLAESDGEDLCTPLKKPKSGMSK